MSGVGPGPRPAAPQQDAQHAWREQDYAWDRRLLQAAPLAGGDVKSTGGDSASIAMQQDDLPGSGVQQQLLMAAPSMQHRPGSVQQQQMHPASCLVSN